MPAKPDDDEAPGEVTPPDEPDGSIPDDADGAEQSDESENPPDVGENDDNDKEDDSDHSGESDPGHEVDHGSSDGGDGEQGDEGDSDDSDDDGSRWPVREPDRQPWCVDRSGSVHIGPAGRWVRKSRRNSKEADSHRWARADRSDSRRSMVTERPQNRKAAHRADRTGNSHRYQEEDNAARGYQGAHRVESMHRSDETAALHRSSRPGRHHADPDQIRNWR
ncbi:hypothetical protein [Actinoplanes sp. NPDC051494]|uniref:hypothetical protein n=1 Tax=Actinoplanes sp. NPDC051494 TaxID=3363907 RepID=UPI00379148CC